MPSALAESLSDASAEAIVPAPPASTLPKDPGVAAAAVAHQRSLASLRELQTHPAGLDTTYARIGAVAMSFHALLCQCSALSQRSGNGWLSESWGPELMAIARQGYDLMTAAVATATEAGLNDVEQASCLQLSAEVHSGLATLLLYHASGVCTDTARHKELEARAAAFETSASPAIN